MSNVESLPRRILQSIIGFVRGWIESVRVKKRDYLVAAVELILAGLTGFLVAGIVLLVMGYDPIWIYSVLFRYGYSSPGYLGARSAALMMTGLAFSIPILAGVFNIGGESQLYLGALTGLVIAYYTGNIWLGLIAGFIGGAAWGLLIAALRVYRGINEVITAIMLNWTAYYLIIYIILKYLPNPTQSHLSIQIPENMMLSYSSTFWLAVLGAVIAYILLYYTDLGYKMRIAGLSPRTAVYAGFNPRKAILFSMLLGGGLAGYGGALHIIGVASAFDTTMSTVFGLGFAGIGVGLLGRNHPIGIIFASVFYAGLIIGGQFVELYTGAPPYLSDTIIGIIVIALAIPYAYRMMINYITLLRGGGK